MTSKGKDILMGKTVQKIADFFLDYFEFVMLSAWIIMGFYAMCIDDDAAFIVAVIGIFSNAFLIKFSAINKKLDYILENKNVYTKEGR